MFRYPADNCFAIYFRCRFRYCLTPFLWNLCFYHCKKAMFENTFKTFIFFKEFLSFSKPVKNIILGSKQTNTLFIFSLINSYKKFGEQHKKALIENRKSSPQCRSLCSADCFKILDYASTDFQLKIKEAIHIKFENPSLNAQVKHVNLKLSL